MSDSLKMVEIEVNHHCNKSCSYCPNSVADRKNTGEMSEELFLKIIKDLVAMDYRGSISYEFYNEPMLAKKIMWFVATTRKYLPHSMIDFYSNGTLLSREKLLELNDLGVTRFIITKHENVKNYIFDEVYREIGPEIKDKIVYKHFTELRLSNRGGTVKAGPEAIPALTPCYIPSFLSVITVTGNVLPCFEDFHEEQIMGNITEQSMEEIWQSDNFTKFRLQLKRGQRHLHSPCKNCNRLQVVYKAFHEK